MIERLAALRPDFLFSFYYRRMLSSRRCWRYRRAARSTCTVRCCPNTAAACPSPGPSSRAKPKPAPPCTACWKSQMRAKSWRQSVPILPDDTARDVFGKVTVAAEMLLNRVLPDLLDGTAPHLPLDLDRRAATSAVASRRMAASTGRGRRKPSTTWCAPWPRPIRAPSTDIAGADSGSCAASIRGASRRPVRRPPDPVPR